MAVTSIVSECFVVQPPLTSDEGVIVGRNAYRADTEATELVYFAAVTTAPDTQKCTSVEIPGAATFPVILNRPAGVWGADWGANEKKVTVAVSWSFEADDEKSKLTATDLTRLALERSATVQEAIDTIGALVEAHNDDDVAAVQQCFVIAGEKEAWLLNVVGKLWAAEHIESDFRRIGSGLSLATTLTQTSAGLREKAVDLALWSGEGDFHFGNVFETAAAKAVSAQEYTLPLPTVEPGAFDLLQMFEVLREAAAASEREPHPSGLPPSASQVSTICINGGGCTPVTCQWFTATPNAIASVYKPFVFTRNVRISPLTQLCAADGDAAGAAASDDGHSITRLHRLHAVRKEAKVGVLLRSLEQSCVQEVHNFLSAAEPPAQELDELLKDCVEAEVKFYR